MEILHASTVSVQGRAALITGPSGSGKSGLALQLMALGANLVSDDRTIVSEKDGGLLATPPDALRGKIEARGVGVLAADCSDVAQVVLVVDLSKASSQRLPPMTKTSILGVDIELVCGQKTPNLAAVVIHYLKGGRVA